MSALPESSTVKIAVSPIVMVGGGAGVTVTIALPLIAPLVTLTMKGPPAVVALKSPVEPIAPPPFTDHVNVGYGNGVLPAPSLATSVNCWSWPDTTIAVAGVTVMLASGPPTGAPASFPLVPPGPVPPDDDGPPGVVTHGFPFEEHGSVS